MCCMCSIAQRNWYLKLLETHLNVPDPATRRSRRAALLKALRVKTASYTDAVFSVGIITKTNKKHVQMAEHLNNHWFGAGKNLQSAWWPDQEYAEEVIKQATIEFLAEKSYADLPIQTIWVCSGEYFECVLLKSAVQLTFIMVTPPIPGGHVLPASKHKEDIVVVASNEEAEYCARAAARQGGTPPIRKKNLGRYKSVSIMDCFSEDPRGT